MSNDEELTLYLYASLDGLLKILEKGKLKVSLPWGTNDITEGVPRNEQMRNYQTEAYGYICLSDNCTSPAMWGYYADRGRGACLVFRLPWINHYGGTGKWKIANPVVRGKFLPGLLAKVIYGKNRCDFTSAEKLLCCKSEDWKHESEYRYIIKLTDTELGGIIDTMYGKQGQYFISDFVRYLTGIILGPHCQLQPIDICKHLTKYAGQTYISPDTEVVKAKFSPDTYSFIRQDDSPLEITGKFLIPSNPKPPFKWKKPDD